MSDDLGSYGCEFINKLNLITQHFDRVLGWEVSLVKDLPTVFKYKHLFLLQG
jgi:hypothetical protein